MQLPGSTNPTAFYSNPRAQTRTRSNHNPNPHSAGPRAPRYFFTGPRPPAHATGTQRPLLPTPSHPTQPFPPPNGLNQPMDPISDLSLSGSRSRPPNPHKNSIFQVCQRRGHDALACWFRFDTRYGEPVYPPYHAYVAHTAVPSTSTSTDWFNDSGASHHVTSDLNNLSNFAPYEGPDSLQIRNGTGMRILHIGSSSLNLHNHLFVLTDILHVPSFTKNILSLSKLLANNSLTIEFSSSVCVIKDRTTSLPLLQAKLHRGLYFISFPSSSLQAYLGERVSADV